MKRFGYIFNVQLYVTVCFCSAICLLASCGKSGSTYPSSNERLEYSFVKTESPCVMRPPAVSSQQGWPGYGHNLMVRVGCQSGLLVSDDVSAERLLALSLKHNDPVVEYGVKRVEASAGLTLILLRIEGVDYESAAQIVESFIDLRPHSERIAIYGWGEKIIQISDFRHSREGLKLLLPRMARVNQDGKSREINDVVSSVTSILAETDAFKLDAMRSVYVISDTPLSVNQSFESLGAEFIWLAPSFNGFYNLDSMVTWGDGSAEELAAEASTRLDEVSSLGYVQLALCNEPVLDNIGLVSGESFSGITLDAAVDKQMAVDCSVNDILSNVRTAVSSVAVSFDDAGRLTYQSRLNELDRLIVEYGLWGISGIIRLLTEGYGSAKDEFDALVSLNTGQDGVPSKIHIRGQKAAFCDRKSFTVNLESNALRYLSPGSASDEFYLIAGCEDSAFLGFLGNTIYSDNGLFPLATHYVDFVLDGENQGVYQLTEKRKEKLLRYHSRLRGIVRRRYESIVPADVNSLIGHEVQLREVYTALLGEGVAEADYIEFLSERLDINTYLTWVAVNSLFMNSDSLDETIFISTESLSGTGEPSDYFHLMGWDTENIFTECGSDSGLDDPYQLTYCQRSTLDQRILNHDALYERYIEILTRVIERTTEERVNEIIDTAVDQIHSLIKVDDVALKTQWPGVMDEATAMVYLSILKAEVLQSFRDRRAVLLTRIDEI